MHRPRAGPAMPCTRSCGIDDVEWPGAHAAGAHGVVDRVGMRSHERFDLLVGLRCGGCRELASAVASERGLRQHRPHQLEAPHQPVHVVVLGQEVGVDAAAGAVGSALAGVTLPRLLASAGTHDTSTRGRTPACGRGRQLADHEVELQIGDRSRSGCSRTKPPASAMLVGSACRRGGRRHSHTPRSPPHACRTACQTSP